MIKEYVCKKSFETSSILSSKCILAESTNVPSFPHKHNHGAIGEEQSSQRLLWAYYTPYYFWKYFEIFISTTQALYITPQRGANKISNSHAPSALSKPMRDQSFHRIHKIRWISQIQKLFEFWNSATSGDFWRFPRFSVNIREPERPIDFATLDIFLASELLNFGHWIR